MDFLDFSCFHLVLIFSLHGVVYSSDGDFAEMKARCRAKNKNDIEYLEETYFNNKKFIVYNTTKGIWTGYTPHGTQLASQFNAEPLSHATKTAAKDILCVANVEALYSFLQNFTYKPLVKLRSVESRGTKNSAMLVCSAYDFYPKTIIITWLKNGQVMTSNLTSTEELANGDWSHQIHSHLEYTPTPGERITCMVEHISLTEPQLYDWDPSMTNSEKNRIVTGASGMLLGLVFATAGLIFYRKKCTGLVQVPINDMGDSTDEMD
ncbi:hypothetical protein UPYG_G00156500 [Umbra pygmaea]|uniref:Ig-like domain-containing protein n=1 Tax=Umbra pygmaea TaxID=75934 RepID=A0ABD0XIX1_UMBPY